MKKYKINGGGGNNSLKTFAFAGVSMAQRTDGKENEVLFSQESKPKEPACKIKKLAAFTLAEVLITLVIIGVVAALTIPSVVVSYQKHQTVTQLKKVYSSLAQAMNKAIADYGSSKNWDIEGIGGKEIAEKYLMPYLRVVKNCEYGTTGDCEFKWAYLKSPNDHTVYDANYYKLILNDGSVLFIRFTNTDTSVTACSTIEVDVNGKKGPNVFGKDIFQLGMWIKGTAYEGQIVPNVIGSDRDTLLNSKNCSKQGTGRTDGRGKGCAALIMLDGWQIKDDYPW